MWLLSLGTFAKTYKNFFLFFFQIAFSRPISVATFGELYKGNPTIDCILRVTGGYINDIWTQIRQ